MLDGEFRIDEEPRLNEIIALILYTFQAVIIDQCYTCLDQLNTVKDLTFAQIAKLFPAQVQARFSDAESVSDAQSRLRRYRSEGIGLVVYGDPEYPERLRTIYRPPIILFARGNAARINTAPGLMAIVGSRKGDSIGCEIASQFGESLARCGVCVVSGLAYGIDAAAHRGALKGEAKLPTVAVLGSGLHNIYPALHRPLARQILDAGGVIISQFEPEARPFPSNFLNRNRVIAGISQGVVVVQAPLRSGSLATARFALEEGRDVLVVPGAINDMRYGGSNRLLQQGAHLVLGKDDLKDFFSHCKESEPAKNGEEQFTPLQELILSTLSESPSMPYEQLCSLLPADQGASELLELELRGSVKRLPGNIIALTATSRF